jgi:hypothetical protein
MFCTQCGANNADDASTCVQCGRALQPPPPLSPQAGTPPGVILPPGQQHPVHVPNYLVPAILVTILCCLPAGIVAIVYAAQVNAKLAGGDTAGALESSRNARNWCWISASIGIVIGIAYGFITFLGLMTGIHHR